MARAMRWCFTYNTPEDGWRPVFNGEKMDYLVWELETAPTTGRRHIQGYLRLKKRAMMETVKRLLRNSVHLEAAKGSEGQNRDYCSKERTDGNWEEHGVCDQNLRQGRRLDLETVTTKVLNGEPLSEIASSHPVEWTKFHAGLTSLRNTTQELPPLKRSVRVIVLWGPTGVGKTHRCLMSYPDSTIISSGRDPFGAYTGGKEIVFDEFSDRDWPIRDMNRYLDCWRCKLNCRYFDKYAYWSTVMICSNTNPATWYQFEDEALRAAFFRRCTEIIYVESKEQIIQMKTIIDILNS